jgi:hypothetical protein
MANPGKDTLYIEAEDEITAVIDKVVNVKHKVVAVVLPKHATVFQSIVNQKLLKKAAISAKKNVVLITSDKNIVAIAGSVGLHVAKTPTSKPSIPAAVIATAAVAENIDLDNSSDDNKALVASAVVTSKANDTIPLNSDAENDTLELDNTQPDDTAVEPVTTKKKKTTKIPDFSSFTFRLALGIGAVILLTGLWVLGFVILPKATVTVNTDVSTTSVNTKITAQISADELNLENYTIPATRVQVEKIDSVTVPATGEKNIGQKATGTINLTNCIKSDGVQVVPAGTRFSAGSVTFETSEQAILPESTFNASQTVCKSKDNGDDLTVSAVALEPGTQSNIDSQSLTSSISGIVAVGSKMTGGTSEIVKVISQEDVNNATQTLSGSSKNQALSELQQQLETDGRRPIDVTLVSSEPVVVSAPAIGAEAAETKVTMTVNYSMLGLEDDDLSQILDAEIKNNLGDTPVNIRDNGLENVIFTVVGTPDAANTDMTIETVATIGPEINEAELKASIVGIKRGDIEKQIEEIDGVRSVSVEYSPAWITTTPKSADKITIIFVEGEDNQ